MRSVSSASILNTVPYVSHTAPMARRIPGNITVQTCSAVTDSAIRTTTHQLI